MGHFVTRHLPAGAQHPLEAATDALGLVSAQANDR